MSSKVRLEWPLRRSTELEIHHVVIGVVRILRSIDRANLNDWRPSEIEIPIVIPGHVVMPHWHEEGSRFSINPPLHFEKYQ